MPTVPSSSQTTNRKTSADDHWVDALAGFMERVVPDAITTSILLLVALFGLSLALGSPLTASMDAYYRGLWMLLQFTMQMTLILVLSLIVGATPASRFPVDVWLPADLRGDVVCDGRGRVHLSSVLVPHDFSEGRTRSATL